MKNDWQAISLGKLVTLERRPVKVNPDEEYAEIGIYSYGRGIFHKQPRSGVQVGDKDLFLIREGDFILQVTFAWEGAVGLASVREDGMYGSVRFPTFQVDESECYAPFLVNYFKTRQGREQLLKISPGSAGRNRVLSLKRIPEIVIPLPPLPEQQRIVARIEELARRVEEARGLRKTAVEEADALLEIAVGKVFENQTPIEARLLGRLATKIGSGSTPTGGRASYPSSGIPFIRSQNVRMREFQMEGIAFIDEATHKSMKGTIVQPNDVLLNITGASIGRVACVPDDLKEANINQHVAIIRPTQELHPRYLMYWLSQPKIQEFINSEQKGATRQGFTKQQIEKFNVLLLPLDEQHRIVAHLDNLQQKVDELRRLQTATQKELDALMPSILAKAFAGEL